MALTYAVMVKLYNQVSGPAKQAMASAKQLAHSIKTQATVAANAAKKFKRSGVDLHQLAQEAEAAEKTLESLKDTSGQLESYKKLDNKLQTTTSRLDQAKKKAAELQKQLGATAKPTKALIKQAEKAAEAIQRLEERQLRETAQLAKKQKQLIDASVPMHNLQAAEEHLKSAIDSTTQSLNKQQAALSKVMASEARRARQAELAQQARNHLQNRLQMQQDIAGVAYPALAAGTAGITAAVQPIAMSALQSDAVTDISITGNLNKEERLKLAAKLRAVALQTNQYHDEINKGVKVLVASGMDAKEAASYSNLLGDTATATRANMEDISNLTFSLKNSLKIEGATEMSRAMNNLVFTGKEGQFELADMARYFPSLASQEASMGSVGQNAVKQLGVAMTAARKAAGTAQEAVANMQNWYSHMTASETIDNFKDLGIDYEKEMLARVQAADPSKRMSAFMASIDVFDSYIDQLTAGKVFEIKGDKGAESKQSVLSMIPAATKPKKAPEKLDFRTALEKAVKDGNEEEVKNIVARFGLSKVIQDMQTAKFYLAMRQNKKFIQDATKALESGDVQNTIANDKAERLAETTEKWKALKIQAKDLAVSMGDTLIPTVKKLLDQVTPTIEKFKAWIEANPELTQKILTTALVASAVIAAFGGITVALISVLGPFALLSYALTRLRTAMQIGERFRSLGGAFQKARTGLSWLKTGFSQLWRLLMFGGRLLLATPIGLAITAIIVLGYLLWKNWDWVSKKAELTGAAIKAFFTDTSWGRGAAKAFEFFMHPAESVLKLIGQMKEKWDATKSVLAETGWGRVLVPLLDTFIHPLDSIKQLVDFLGGKWIETRNALDDTAWGRGFLWALERLNTPLENLKDTFMWLMDTLETIKQYAADGLDFAEPYVAGAKNGLSAAASTFVTINKNAINNTWSRFTNWWKGDKQGNQTNPTGAQNLPEAANAPEFKGGIKEKLGYAVGFMQNLGWNRQQAIGIVANLKQESELRPSIEGDGGAAYGVAQWHADRQAEFRRVFGKSIRGSSLEDQLRFVHYEMTKGNEQGAGRKLKATQTAQDAAAVVSRYYERPLAREVEMTRRAGIASSIIKTLAANDASQPPRTSPIKPIQSTAGAVKQLTGEVRGQHELTVNLKAAPGVVYNIEDKKTTGQASRFDVGKQAGAL